MTVAESIPRPGPATYQDIVDVPEHLIGGSYHRKPGDPRGTGELGRWWEG